MTLREAIGLGATTEEYWANTEAELIRFLKDKYGS